MGCKFSSEADGIIEECTYDIDDKHAAKNADPTMFKLGRSHQALRKLFVPSQCFVWQIDADAPSDEQHDHLLEDLRFWYSGHHPTSLQFDHYSAYRATHPTSGETSIGKFVTDNADLKEGEHFRRSLTSVTLFRKPRVLRSGISSSDTLDSDSSYIKPVHTMATTTNGVKEQMKLIGDLAFCGVRVIDMFQTPHAREEKPIDVMEPMPFLLRVQLCFPPSSDWLGAGKKLSKFVATRKHEETTEVFHKNQYKRSASVVQQTIHAVIEGFFQAPRLFDKSGQSNQHQDCTTLKLTRLMLQDAKTDSWLPQDHILQGIGSFLNTRVTKALNGTETRKFRRRSLSSLSMLKADGI